MRIPAEKVRQLTLIKMIILGFIGLSSGVAISGAVFAFITMIGLVTRLASRTNTAKHINLYEDCFTLGGTIGNIVYIFQLSVPIHLFGVGLYGMFSGIFVGCLSIALAEVLDTIPIFSRRVNLKKGIPYIVLALALGKGVGSFIQLYLYR